MARHHPGIDLLLILLRSDPGCFDVQAILLLQRQEEAIVIIPKKPTEQRVCAGASPRRHSHPFVKHYQGQPWEGDGG